MSPSNSFSLAPPPAEELAAIVAAVEMTWPRAQPIAVPAAASQQGREAWRWSGRWWGPRQMASARRRPW